MTADLTPYHAQVVVSRIPVREYLPDAIAPDCEYLLVH
jgi:hypothetical protein